MSDLFSAVLHTTIVCINKHSCLDGLLNAEPG